MQSLHRCMLGLLQVDYARLIRRTFAHHAHKHDCMCIIYHDAYLPGRVAILLHQFADDLAHPLASKVGCVSGGRRYGAPRTCRRHSAGTHEGMSQGFA